MRGKSYPIVSLVLFLLVAVQLEAQEVVRVDPPADYVITGSIQLDSRAGGTAGPLDPLLGQNNQFRILLNDAQIRHTFFHGVGAGTTHYTFHPTSFDVDFSGPNAALLNSLIAPYLSGGSEAGGSVLRYDSLLGNLRLTMEAEWPCDVSAAGFAFTSNTGVFNGVPPLGSHGGTPTTTIRIELPSGVSYEGSLQTQTPGDAFTISAVPEPALGGVMLLMGVGLLRRVRR